MNRTLRVTNLSPSTDQRHLRELFNQAGQCASMLMVRDSMSGQDRVVVYIEMESEDGARAAVARFDRYTYAGQTLSVTADGLDRENPGPDGK